MTDLWRRETNARRWQRRQAARGLDLEDVSVQSCNEEGIGATDTRERNVLAVRLFEGAQTCRQH